MSRLYVARRPQRKALYLPMGQTSKSPSLLIPLTRKLDRSELDELIRIELEKLGITKESDVQSVLDKAETDYETRIKVQEARKELRRLMDLKKQGAKLISAGHKKWKEVFYLGEKRR